MKCLIVFLLLNAGCVNASFEVAEGDFSETGDETLGTPHPDAESDAPGDTQPDAGSDDASDSGTATVDSAIIDTGTLSVDSAIVDTGIIDTGTADTGKIDTGVIDTGKPDTGKADTGTCKWCQYGNCVADEDMGCRTSCSSTGHARCLWDPTMTPSCFCLD